MQFTHRCNPWIRIRLAQLTSLIQGENEHEASRASRYAGKVTQTSTGSNNHSSVIFLAFTASLAHRKQVLDLIRTNDRIEDTESL